MLLRSDLRIPVAFVAFDVLSLEGTNTMGEPYWKRREILERESIAELGGSPNECQLAMRMKQAR